MNMVYLLTKKDVEEICHEILDQRISTFAADLMKEMAARIPSNRPRILMHNDSIELLACGVRLHNSLCQAGIKTIGDICKRSKLDFRKLPKFGHATMLELRTRLAANGLSLRGETP